MRKPVQLMTRLLHLRPWSLGDLQAYYAHQSNPEVAFFDRRTNETAVSGKFVITPEHFEQIAGWLEPPGPEEQVHRLDTSTGLLPEQLVPVDDWLSRQR